MADLVKVFIIILLLQCISVVSAQATPTQFGVSGLFGQPSADTLDSGNISVGLWVNSSAQPEQDIATIIPVSLTLGLGSFLEAYGSFPNLLFNDEEANSGRGYANLGLKARILGKRSSPYKLAVDLQAWRRISDDPERDGKTDLQARLILTAKKGRFGLHTNAGFLKNDDSYTEKDQVVAGVGIEFFPLARLRLIAELEGKTERLSGSDNEAELLAGVQYFFSPHLTLHLAAGAGLSDTSPDWRVLAGLSTSQGIGTFTKPIPRIIEPLPEEPEQPKPPKKSKFKTITPLLPMSRLSKPEPKIESELPVNPGEEEILVEPENRIKLASNALPVTPLSSPDPKIAGMTKQTSGESRPEKPISTVVYRKFRFDDVSFGYDQDSLSEAGVRAVAQVAEALRKEKKWFLIRINGHTDAVGSDAYNIKLSNRRASSVGRQLVLYEGFDPARLFIKGIGEADPIASNKTAEGRRKNRRVEILVLLPQKEG